MAKLKIRRILAALVALTGVGIWVVLNPSSYEQALTRVNELASVSGETQASETDSTGVGGETQALSSGENESDDSNAPLATEILAQLAVKGRAPKTGYEREEFYSSWPTVDGCNLRQRIIKREFGESAVLGEDGCDVVAGEFTEPYTGQHLSFTEKSQISTGVQIDHVVALSDAWQKGAQYMSAEERYAMATDPLNLLAVDASANQGKSDGDAATWLPSNKGFRCQYVARQVSVKYKYALWVTEAEKSAIERVLESCPNQRAVGV